MHVPIILSGARQAADEIRETIADIHPASIAELLDLAEVVA